MKPKYGYYDVLLKTCAKYPSSIAIRVYEDDQYKTYTYSELYGVCEYMVQNIQQITCDKGIIGLITDRNAIIPSLVAASHKCSTTFMFIDPLQDIDAAIRNIKPNIVIHVQDQSKGHCNLFSKSPNKVIDIFNFRINIYKLQFNSQLSNFIEDHSFIAKTSGSTGDGKYIQVPVKCLQPNVEDLTKLFDITSEDVIYFSTPLTFDPSMVEILLACINAASLLIAPERADILFSNNMKNSVTFWQTTPSKFFQYSDADIKNKILSAESTLKVLALGGEPLSGIRRFRELKDVANSTKLFTLYGVTEMSCWACVAELDLDKISDDTEVPLGNCLSETELFVKKAEVNSNSGNIVLVSKTRKCVVLNIEKNMKEDCEGLDTGDIGEVKNGNVYYRGRKDDVIKRFGNKVSLQHIEAMVKQHSEVTSCSCIWLPKLRILVLYYTSATIKTKDLKDFLKLKLDDKHWPDKIIRLENLPVNPHGKTSKVMLSQIFIDQPKSDKNMDMKTLIMEELNTILNKSLSYTEVYQKDFLSIGGSSILAVLLSNKLSLQYADLGKLILPYLLNPKYSIEDIINIILKKHNVPKKKPRKRKLSVSKTTSITVHSHISDIMFDVVWSYNTGRCVDATPTLFQDDFKMYATVGSHSGKIIVAEATSGKIQGVMSVDSRVEASVVCISILTYPCGIVGTYDGTIVCFRLQDCKLVWKTNIGCMIKSKGVAINGEFYVASYDGNIRILDFINGKIKETLSIVDQGITADLVLAHERYILVGTLSGMCACVDTITKCICWSILLSSPVFATPGLYSDDEFVVFAEVNGPLHCRTVKNGRKVWEYNGSKGHIFSSIFFKKIKSGWKMIYGCHDNNVYCIVIRNSQPVLYWKALMTSPVYSTPCSFRDKYIIAVSNNGVLCMISSAKGHTISTYQLPNEVFSSPKVCSDNIYIGCRDDSLYCIKCIME